MTLGKQTTLFLVTRLHHLPPLIEAVTPDEAISHSVRIDLDSVRFGKNSVRFKNYLQNQKAIYNILITT
jgi:hypothetical protein